MKITIQRSLLLERLTQVTKAVGAKITMPILEGVLVKSNGELTLSCSDTVFSITTTISDYTEHVEGAAVIPAKKLLEIIKKMPDKPIGIEVNDKSAIVSCGSTKVTLPAMDAEEFPETGRGATSTFTIDGAAFSQLVDSTLFAVSTNENSPVLQGVCLYRSPESIIAVATDRSRLAEHAITFNTGAEETTKHVLSKRILEVAAQFKEQLEIGLTNSVAYIKSADYLLTASLVDGTYPETAKLFPKQPTIKISTDTKLLLRTLELAEKVLEEKTKVVSLQASNGELLISAKDGDSSMVESLEAVITGDDIKLSANAKNVIDALKCIRQEQTEFLLTGPLSPIILRGLGDEQSRYLVMPYRTQG